MRDRKLRVVSMQMAWKSMLLDGYSEEQVKLGKSRDSKMEPTYTQ